MLSKQNLNDLREEFNLEAAKQKLSIVTQVRYRSWIRRLLRHCRSYGLELNSEAAKSFISTYHSSNTRRQAYFALRFLFENVMKCEQFPELSAIHPKTKALGERWRKWWRWYNRPLI